MCDYVKEIVASWDKEISKQEGDGFKIIKGKTTSKASAAPENLFRVDENSIKLDSNSAVVFYNIVAKTLFITKKARPDISTAIAFLTTRVRDPDVDDLEKAPTSG